MAGATRTLLTKNKIAMRSIQLQEKTAVAGVVEPDEGYDGLYKVTIAGAGILEATHKIENGDHVFTLKSEDADLTIKTAEGKWGLDNFIIRSTFNADFAKNKTIIIRDAKYASANAEEKVSHQTDKLTCYNIYNKDKQQAAVTGSFKKDDTDLIEIYRTEKAAVINPRVAIWSS